LDDAALLRYSRHLLLGEIGIEGQERIARARILVVGAGGLGSPAMLYLAAAGVARLTVVDGDVVDLGNLQRQIIHTTARIGQDKADSAASALRALNPHVHVVARPERATPSNLGGLLGQVDLVLDCSDNRATRYAINRACLAARLPLVSGSASRFAGQLAVFDFRQVGAPCYACLFPEGDGEDDACATTGIFAPLTGIMGCLQAGEALKLIAMGELAPGGGKRGRMLAVDALGLEFRTLEFARDPNCRACAGQDGTIPVRP
jgi:molybdopterin/thiamine biosynthesis adenylyltransferase